MFGFFLMYSFYFQGCNKKFAQSTNLKSHILTHAKQKSGRGSSLGSPENITMTDSILQPQVSCKKIHTVY
jgi:hypothetical protein